MPAAVTELRFGTCEAAARERAARAPGSAGRAQRGLRQLSRGGAGVVWPEAGRGEATSRGRRRAASARRPSRARTRARNRLRRPARGRIRAPACRTPARLDRVTGACHVIVAPLVAEHGLADWWDGPGAWRASRRRRSAAGAGAGPGSGHAPRADPVARVVPAHDPRLADLVRQPAKVRHAVLHRPGLTDFWKVLDGA